MNIIKRTLFILVVSSPLLLSACISVCCAPPRPDIEKPIQLKIGERRLLINRFINYQENNELEKAAHLFSQNSGNKVTVAKKIDNEKLKQYIKKIREFTFFSDMKTSRNNQPMWVLSYQHETRKHQFLVYYIIKESHQFKILEQRSISQ